MTIVTRDSVFEFIIANLKPKLIARFGAGSSVLQSYNPDLKKIIDKPAYIGLLEIESRVLRNTNQQLIGSAGGAETLETYIVRRRIQFTCLSPNSQFRGSDVADFARAVVATQSYVQSAHSNSPPLAVFKPISYSIKDNYLDNEDFYRQAAVFDVWVGSVSTLDPESADVVTEITYVDGGEILNNGTSL